MYGFEATDEQQMLIDAVQRFAENDLRPAAHEAEETGELPPALIERGWELGILQASIPEEFGGFGEHSAVTGVLAAEAMAWGDLAGTLAVMTPNSFALPILLGGTAEQKAEWLPVVIEAEWKPFVAAFQEPKFDFHAFDLTCMAERKNGAYVLNGEKTMVPFADTAEGMLVFADLDGTPQAFRVTPDQPGISIGEREKLLGLNALPLFQVGFTDVEVPGADRLGGEDGFDPGPVISSIQVAIAAMAVGLSKAALDYALPYAKEREVWGVPIAQRQSIAFMLAEMAIEIESIRLLVWEAAWRLDESLDASKEAYLALTGAVDMAMMTTDRAVQVLGGHGYIREHPVELWMRNGRGISSFTGMAMV
jgi:alkylation response protein AidB-like acyl-CoA dehydrogenase